MSSQPEQRAITPEVQELRENILKLTIIQEGHEKILGILVDDQKDNTRFKARVGGIVMSVSVFWVVILAAVEFWRR